MSKINFKQKPYVPVTDGPILVINPKSGKAVDVRHFLEHFHDDAGGDPVFARLNIAAVIEFINTNMGLKTPDLFKMRQALGILHKLHWMYDEMVETNREYVEQ